VQDHPERKRVESLKVLETELRFLKKDLIKLIYDYYQWDVFLLVRMQKFLYPGSAFAQ